MNEQTIPLSNGAANGTPVKSTNDALVDSALEALGDLAGPADNDVAPARKTVPGKKQPQEDAPEAPEDDEQDEDPSTGEPDDEGDEEEAQEASDEDGVEHDPRGSKEEPFKVKDLPADKFIELKVDGEKVVVSLKELASGYIREQTFGQRITKTQQLAQEAQAHAQKFQEERHQLRSATREFLGDADQLFDYYTATEEREQVLTAVAQRLAAQLKRFREQPESRLEYQRQRDMRRIQEERERFEAQKAAEQQARHQQEAQTRFEQVFKPGWAEGLKRAGFPEPTQALWEEVMVRLDQRHKAGKPISPADVAEFTHRAAKLLELPPRNQNKKPRPAPVPLAPKARATSKRGDPWSDKPKHKRTADPDYFLKNLRPKDFR